MRGFVTEMRFYLWDGEREAIKSASYKIDEEETRGIKVFAFFIETSWDVFSPPSFFIIILKKRSSCVKSGETVQGKDKDKN